MSRVWMCCLLICMISAGFMACPEPEGTKDEQSTELVNDASVAEPSKEAPAKDETTNTPDAGETPEPTKPLPEKVIDTSPAQPDQSPNTPDSSTSPDGSFKPPAGTITEQGNWFMSQMALGFCKALHEKCCQGGSLKPQVSSIYGSDTSSCQSRMLMLFRSNGTTDWTRTKIDWQQGQRCWDALAAESCLPGPQASATCMKAILGQQQTGDPCNTDQECSQGLFCDSSKSLCAKQASAGQSCDGKSSVSCEPGYSCSYTNDTCITSGNAGDSCTDADPASCQPNLSCVQGTCTKPDKSQYCQ